MGFYTEPAFFILLGVVVAVAAVLCIAEKPLHKYGLVASVAMLALLFSESIPSLVFLLCYLVLSFGLEQYVERLFQNDAPHKVAKYRVALAAQIAPLFVYKVGVLFDPGFLGFIGISYITFKAVQVLIETRDGLITRLKPFDYLYFLIFFPTFTSGPIMRSRPSPVAETYPEIDEFLQLLRNPPCELIVVTREMNMGLPSDSIEIRRYRDVVGRMNQRIAAISQNVWLCVSGLPLKLK